MVRPDYYDDYRNLPEYYDTMFLDGFNPQQILTAAHQTMIEELTGGGPDDTPPITIKSEVNFE